MSIPADDRGFTLGVGLFETMLAIDGVPQFWGEHLARLARGCAHLSLPAPDANDCTIAAADALLREELMEGRAALRLTWTGGSGARGLAGPASPDPRLVAAASPAPGVPASLSLATVGVRRNASSPTSRVKTLSYLDNVVARQQAAAAGADEALMLDTEGNLACAAAANLFWFSGETLCTPALDCGVLDGIIRAEVLRAARAGGLMVEEVHAPPAALAQSDGAFLTNSLVGAVTVSSLDGRALASPAARLSWVLSQAAPRRAPHAAPAELAPQTTG
jgi:branched-chain amino acid aminotransferase/4-amino-4-deoxychorismate lyase